MAFDETGSGYPTVLDSADRARVVLEPFPHIVVENALPQSVYEKLSAAFPPLSVLNSDLAATSNKRFNLFASWGPTELPSDATPETWREFLAAHTSLAFVKKVFDLFPIALRENPELGERFLRTEVFGDGLDRMLALKGPVSEREIIARATVAINTPATSATSVRGPHVDSRWKAYVGLYYLRASDDDSVGGDLSLYRVKPGADIRPWSNKADPESVERFTTIRYAPNTYVLMLNTHDSLHGVTVREPTRHVRRFAVTSGWFPGVDESGLLGRRKSLLERVKDLVRPIVARPTVAEYQD